MGQVSHGAAIPKAKTLARSAGALAAGGPFRLYCRADRRAGPKLLSWLIEGHDARRSPCCRARSRPCAAYALGLRFPRAQRSSVAASVSGSRSLWALRWSQALLLLDEPTQSLDIGRQVELIDLLHYLRDEGITILASIHDLHLIHHNFSFVHLMGPDHSLISGIPRMF